MKYIFLFTLLFSFNSAFACDTPAQDRDLFKLFHLDGEPTTWRSVKRFSYKRDKGFPITIFAEESVEESSVKLRRKTYTLEQVEFCLKSAKEVTITHPEYGELDVFRERTGSESYVLLKSGLISYTLRPIQFTEE